MITWHHLAAEAGWYRRTWVAVFPAILYKVAAKDKVIPASGRLRRACASGRI